MVKSFKNLNSEMKNQEAEKFRADSSSLCIKDEFFSDMLLWLRRAALDPCNHKQSSDNVRRRQILKARELLFLSNTEFPWVIKSNTFISLFNSFSP